MLLRLPARIVLCAATRYPRRNADSLPLSSNHTMSSSQASSNTKAASRTYRIKNLKRARIFVNQIEREAWPQNIAAFAEFLTKGDFCGIISEEDVSGCRCLCVIYVVHLFAALPACRDVSSLVKRDFVSFLCKHSAIMRLKTMSAERL